MRLVIRFTDEEGGFVCADEGGVKVFHHRVDALNYIAGRIHRPCCVEPA